MNFYRLGASQGRRALALRGIAIVVLASVCSLAVASDDYRVAPRDLLRFQIFDEPDTQIVQRVSATGEMPLPMVGVVGVQGLTLREVEAKLKRLYVDGGFFVNPQVILVLEEYDERSVSVLGQVNRPGQVSLPLEAESVSLIHAITLAGGLTRLARPDDDRIKRKDLRSGGEEKTFVVNIKQYLSNRQSDLEGSEDFKLLPGDVVFVPERSF